MSNTNRRLRRPSRAYLCKQSALGAIASDFTLGSDCIRVWSTEVETEPMRGKSRPGPWMSQSETEDAVGRYSLPEKSEGVLAALGTPKNLELFLRSNWGPYGAGAFALSRQVNEYFTLAWVEGAVGGTQKLIRLQDLFIHRLRLAFRRKTGKLLLLGDYAARRTPVTPLDNLGGVVLPAASAPPTDRRVFNVRGAVFRRDPAGANVNLAYERLDVTLEQNGVSEWTKSDGWVVYKGGKTFAKVEFDGVLADETWQLISDNMANLRETMRVQAVAPADPTGINAASTFTMDLANVDFEVSPIGHKAQGWEVFRGVGRSHKSGSAFATMQLS